MAERQAAGRTMAAVAGLASAAPAGITPWCVSGRAALPGLFNMSTDGRTTGPFWATFIGGAALDMARVATWLLLATMLMLHLFLPSRARRGRGSAPPTATLNGPSP
jgi:hypothetical protein